MSLPIITTITRLLCRELTLQNEYLKTENKILKSKFKNRLVFCDDEPLALVEAALALGKDLIEDVVSYRKPETIRYCRIPLSFTAAVLDRNNRYVNDFRFSSSPSK